MSKIIGAIIALPFIVLALYVAARFVKCRPDSQVVRIATPMVEKIADHIVANGVPESLADIPELPYGLEGCERKVRYRKPVGIYYKDTNIKENADFSIIDEKCYFANKNKMAKVWFWFLKDYRNKKKDSGKLSIKFEKTSVGITLKTQNNKLIREEVGTGFDNRFGFCQQFKM